MALLVVEKDAQKNKVHDRTQLIRQAPKKFLYVVMRSNGARNLAQGLVPSLREGLTKIGLECGMHRTGKKRHFPAPQPNLAVRIIRMSKGRVTNATDHLVGRLKRLDVPIDESDA